MSDDSRFTLISNPNFNKVSNKTKADKLGDIRQHLRAIESNLAHVNQKAKDVNWEELSDLIASIHMDVCQALKLAKTRDKGFIEEVKTQKKRLTIVKDED